MITIVQPAEYGRYESELREMFRLRYRVFRERLGWDVHTEDGEERDEFDALNPTYVLAFDERRTVIGSWRLLPTTGPTMLRDVFPELLDGQAMPNSDAVWETSRFALDPDRLDCTSLGSVNRATSEIFCGLIEHCLESGISEIVTVYDLLIARILRRIGCDSTWQGSVHRIGNGKALAGLFSADLEQLSRIRNLAGINGTVLSPTTDTLIGNLDGKEQAEVAHA